MEKTKRTIAQRVFKIAHVNLALLLVLLSILGYTLFAPITPAVYDKPTLVTKSDEIQAGKKFTYKIHTCRNVGDGVATTVTRKLVSTTDKQLVPIILSADTLTNPARCLDSSKTLIIPSSTPPGEYQLVVTGIYQVIPFRKPITVQASTDSFTVKAGDPNQVIVSSEEAAISIPGGSSNGTNPKAVTNSGSTNTSVRSAPTSSSVTNNTTNNTTTNNTVNPDTQKETGTPSQGFIPDLVRNLTGIRLPL